MPESTEVMVKVVFSLHQVFFFVKEEKENQNKGKF